MVSICIALHSIDHILTHTHTHTHTYTHTDGVKATQSAWLEEKCNIMLHKDKSRSLESFVKRTHSSFTCFCLAAYVLRCATMPGWTKIDDSKLKKAFINKCRARAGENSSRPECTP